MALQCGWSLEGDIFDGNQVHLPICRRLIHHRFRLCDVGDAILEKSTVYVVNAHGAALRAAGAGDGAITFRNCDRNILETVIGGAHVIYQRAAVGVRQGGSSSKQG